MSAMRCADVDNLAHPYVDGELISGDRLLFETHLAECGRCRDLVAFQTNFKASLRARLRRPEAPEALRGRVLAALDHADAQARQSLPSLASRWRRMMPVGAGVGLAAAAVMLILFGTSVQSQAASPIIEEAVHGHCKHLPVEVGGTDENIRNWMAGKVAIPVRPPHLRRPHQGGAPVSLVGARIYHLRNRDAAQLVYRVGAAQLTVYVFDPAGMEMRAPLVRTIDDHEVYGGEASGYNVLFYRDRGVGYAFASDMDIDELAKMVALALRD